MGAIHVDVTIRNPADPSRSWRGSFLVDTGATDTVVPPECVDAVGLKPRAQRTYKLADGRSVRMNVAGADIEFMNDYVAGLVVFGESGTDALLGVTALESMGVEVDPRNGELRKLSAVRLTMVNRQGLPTFSQAHGYEAMPSMLELEQLDKNARIRIANVLIDHVNKCTHTNAFGRPLVGRYMKSLSRDVHVHHYVQPVDDWSNKRDDVASAFLVIIMQQEFNKVFDMLGYIMRHPECPPNLIEDMSESFSDSHLAYGIDASGPPTIIPMTTKAEGEAIVSSLSTLTDAGLNGSASHLRKSAECINRHEWANSVRESIHAVESVAVTISSRATTLSSALELLKDKTSFHPALKTAILKLYGYTSDEKGIRHALLDDKEASVGKDEALFMLGACASFATYLWRKHSTTTT